MGEVSSIILRVKNNKTLVNGTLFSFFSFVNKGIIFVLLLLLARYIAPAEYGKLSLFNTIVQFLGYFIALSTQGYFSISYFQRKGELFRQDFTSIILIMTCCTTILCVILFFSQNILSSFTEISPSFLWFAIVICVFHVFFYCFMDLLRIQEKITRYGLFSCGFALLNFIMTIYLVVYRKMDWEGRVYSHLICSVLSGILGLVLLAKIRLFSKKVSWSGTKIILLWGIPLIPHEASNWIKQGCDRFIINDAHSIEDVGIFSFALTLTSILIMIGTAFNATNSVSIYQILSSDRPAKQKKQQLIQQMRTIGLIYTSGFIVTLIVGSILVPILLPQYVPCLPYFWITSIYGFLVCLYFLFVNYLFYFHKNQNIMVITFLTAVLHLLLSLVLTRYSLYWTACIYVITQSVVLVLIIRQSLIVLHEKLKD